MKITPGLHNNKFIHGLFICPKQKFLRTAKGEKSRNSITQEVFKPDPKDHHH